MSMVPASPLSLLPIGIFSDTSEAWSLSDFLILGGILLGGFLLIVIVKGLLRQDVKGNEFTTFGLKGLYDRGVLSEEEYKVVKAKMAERVKRQIEEEERQRALEAMGKISAEERLTAELNHTPVGGGAGQSQPTDPPAEIDMGLNPNAPLTDEEIARLQQQELEIRRRLDAARRGKADQR